MSAERAKASSSGPDRLRERARRIREELASLVRDAAELMDLPMDGSDAPEALELRLRLPLAGERVLEDEPVLRAILSQLQQSLSASHAHQAGRVHCFQCGSAACLHASPPDARAVFVAYAATGKPVWKEFTEACLGWGVERVDSLFGEPPGVLAVALDGEAMTSELLQGFGRGETSYRLLGEVACGYLPFRPRPGAALERGALSIQIVGSRRGPGDVHLQLNVVGMGGHEPGRGAPAWWEKRALRDTIRETRDSLRALNLRLSGRRGPIGREMREGVMAILQRLRGDLERLHRPLEHRTQHARQRQQEGERPTHTALQDAARAPDERVLYEPARETLIVLGPKNRVHVFTQDGRHVTSLVHRREAVDRRREREQWIACETERRERFRSAILARLARDEG